MAFNDLREFITALEKHGEIQKIKKDVDWNLEAGAIIRRCNETGGPAQLFEKIKDYPGHRIFGGPLATLRRLAIAMEMSPDATYAEIIDEFFYRQTDPIKPILVNTGPCKEHILVGDDVDLNMFPAPLVHGGDGGRYIGTWNVGACKDPDSDWINWGTYRLMVHDRNSTGIFIVFPQHVGVIFNKYEKMNKPMPYTAFMGVEPLINLIAATGIPHGVNEVDVVGGLRKEPVKLVKCETNDLLVPDTAEIVLEGEILPNIRKDEGPFGEYAGYQISGVMPRPVFKVKAVTYRNNPILPTSCIGTPVDDSHIVVSMGMATGFKKALEDGAYPVTGIYVPPESAYHVVIVATETPYPYIANRIAACIWAQKNGFIVPRVIVVNSDVDPTNMAEVGHALATKCHPVRGTTTIDRLPTSPITGFLSHEERDQGFGCGVVYDCTWPLDWKPEHTPPRSSFNDIYPEEIKERVLNNWKDYGFKK